MSMKLIIATIQDHDEESVCNALLKEEFRFTRVGSTGGFLRQGNTTLLIGVEADRLSKAVEVLSENSERRMRYVPMASGTMPNGLTLYNYVEVEVGGATIFTLDVEHFEQV
jgi:uncharacterized protein YaaQ